MKKISKRFLFFIAIRTSVIILASQIIVKTIYSSTAKERNSFMEANETVLATPKKYEPLKGIRIVLDAGHGGNDAGAVWEDIYEKNITLQITTKLKSVLEALGGIVFTTRDSDVYVSLEDRVRTARAKDADLFLSIHLNSLDDDATVSGIETYCTEAANKKSPVLAEAIQNCLVEETGARDREVRSSSDFYVVKENKIPSCLIETGFLTSEKERPLLLSEDYQNKLVSGISKGILEYYTSIR